MAQIVYFVGTDGRLGEDEHSFGDLQKLLKKGYKVISSESVLRGWSPGNYACSVTEYIAYILEEPTEK
ncbi:hypothetical protein [Breznakia pachnodae]|uniref:Uncharacterized protein n=1 Tax=Breznakia pachnodae TaxID=265178 RepID=A0ABU0E8K4_9FIRM|nr:hypothetical protein [Breznakia pachnodae]MDQ0363227.1 hypothetical protein [Breznakia pachnodae]